MNLKMSKGKCKWLLSIAAIAVLVGCDSGNKSQDTVTNTPSTEQLTGTLQKIKDSGTIVLGYRDSSIPFSYIADRPNQPVGFAHDLQLKIVEAVKEKLGLPDLKIRYNLVTSQNRIPLISNGTVDIECGSTTNNKERSQQVDFTVGFFEVGARLLTNTNSGIQDFNQLAGKKLVTTAGTTSERYIRPLQKELGITEIISAKEHAEAFLILQSGRADAFMMDDVLLAGERTKAKDPNQFTIVGTAPLHEIYGCMLRKDDTPFKEVADNALKSVLTSPEIDTLYTKWFESPTPPKNTNLHFPMSKEVKELYANPHDRDE